MQSGSGSTRKPDNFDASNIIRFTFDEPGNDLVDIFGNCPVTPLSGTTTHHDDEPGVFTASNGVTAGDRYAVIDNNDVVDGIMRTDDLGDGSLSICFTLEVDNIDPADNEHILTWGTSLAGYYRIYNHSSVGGMSFEAYDRNGVRQNLFKGASSWGTGRRTWIMHYDGYLGTWEILNDGEITPEQWLRIENDKTYVNVRGTPPNDVRGLGLFCQHQGGQDNKIFGEDNARVSKCHDVTIIRRSTPDVLISKLAHLYHNNPQGFTRYLQELAE